MASPLEVEDLVEMGSLPNVEDLIRLPSGEVKRFGDCSLEDVQSLMLAIQVEALIRGDDPV